MVIKNVSSVLIRSIYEKTRLDYSIPYESHLILCQKSSLLLMKFLKLIQNFKTFAKVLLNSLLILIKELTFTF